MLIGCEVKNFEWSYLKILLSSFGEEDFQRFTLNLLRLNFGYYLANNASGATTT